MQKAADSFKNQKRMANSALVRTPTMKTLTVQGTGQDNKAIITAQAILRTSTCSSISKAIRDNQRILQSHGLPSAAEQTKLMAS